MSDAETPPPDAPGRRRAFPGMPAGGLSSPAAVAPAVEASFGDGHTTATKAEDLARLRYNRHAATPLPWMAVSAALMLATVWAIDWSELGPGATDPVRSSEWWTNIYRVLLPAAEPRLGSYSQFRMWVTLAIMVATALMIAGWIGALGRNLRPTRSPFGSVLPIVALPAWWILPITIGLSGNGDPSRGDLLVRSLIAFGILFAQFLLLRWPLLNRVWRAGDLPYDMAAIVLWLPMLIPWSMLLLSTSVTLLTTDKGEESDSIWQPTPAMLDWATNLTYATEVLVLVLLVAATVGQHLGIEKDRAEEQARRDEAAAAELPAL